MGTPWNRAEPMHSTIMDSMKTRPIGLLPAKWNAEKVPAMANVTVE